VLAWTLILLVKPPSQLGSQAHTLLVEIVFRLTLNFNPPNRCLLSSWYYMNEPQHPAQCSQLFDIKKTGCIYNCLPQTCSNPIFPGLFLLQLLQTAGFPLSHDRKTPRATFSMFCTTEGRKWKCTSLLHWLTPAFTSHTQVSISCRSSSHWHGTTAKISKLYQHLESAFWEINRNWLPSTTCSASRLFLEFAVLFFFSLSPGGCNHHTQKVQKRTH
jgi:hypothetical protein